MNPITHYISQGISTIFFIYLVLFLSNYTSIFNSIIFVIILLHIIRIIDLSDKTYTSELNVPKLQYFTNNLCNEYNLKKIQLFISKDNSGILKYNYNKPHYIFIPSDSKPFKQDIQAKVVISHEIAHIVNNDYKKYLILYYSIITITSFVFYYLINFDSILFIIFSAFIIIFIPSLYNIRSHLAEYNADEFAVKNTSESAVSIRLRTNQRLIQNPWYRKYLPYIMPHPSIEKRIEKIHKK